MSGGTVCFALFRFSQLLLILLLPFFLQWSLGGFANASVVMVWAFFTPLAAVFFVDTKHAHKWFSAYIFLTLVSGIQDILYTGYTEPMSKLPNTVFFMLNMGVGFIAIYLLLTYFVKDRERSHIMTLKAKEESLAAQKELEKANEILQQNEIVIKELMLTDPLTGVANRRHLDERLDLESKRIQRYGGSLSIIITDIDHFKKINDSHGHHAGDEVLKLFAKLIQESIRATDFVGRFGGEEFVMLLPETDIDSAHNLAERIRQALESTSRLSIETGVTASFGVASTRKQEAAEMILRSADQALYRAKQAGRNQVGIAT